MKSGRVENMLEHGLRRAWGRITGYLRTRTNAILSLSPEVRIRENEIQATLPGLFLLQRVHKIQAARAGPVVVTGRCLQSPLLASPPRK